jgi:hypothetical protein
MATKEVVSHAEGTHNTPSRKSFNQAHIAPIEQEATEDAKHINLSWRSWVVVFVCCWAYVFYQSVRPD